MALDIDEAVDEMLALTPNLPGKPNFNSAEDEFAAHAIGLEWWFERMIDARWINRGPSTPSPLVEKLTFFWHGHFATAQDKVNNMSAMWDQNQLFRTSGLGDFEALAQAVATGPAMLLYLDNEDNVAGAEQENWARECMELFTIGLTEFTQDDVVSMAKAWTGHNLDRHAFEPGLEPEYVFRPDNHDNSQKTLFGITKNWDGPQALTEIVNGSKQEACARFIAAKAWRYFAGPEPSEALLDDLSEAFIASKMVFAELLRALFTHDDFWVDATRNTLVKSPVTYVVDFYKRTSQPVASTGIFKATLRMGQILFDPPNVGGWAGNAHWLSTGGVWSRASFLAGMQAEVASSPFLRDLDRMPVEEGVDAIVAAFGLGTVSNKTRAELETWYSRTVAAGDADMLVRGAVMFVGLCPEFQVV